MVLCGKYGERFTEVRFLGVANRDGLQLSLRSLRWLVKII
jgi:hypothetical protein